MTLLTSNLYAVDWSELDTIINYDTQKTDYVLDIDGLSSDVVTSGTVSGVDVIATDLTVYEDIITSNDVFRLDSLSGRVGIGTSAPSSLLEIQDAEVEIKIGDGTYTHIIKSSDAEGFAGTDLRIGVDESTRNIIFCDTGDIDADVGDMTVSDDPSFWLLREEGTQGGFYSWDRLQLDSAQIIGGIGWNYICAWAHIFSTTSDNAGTSYPNTYDFSSGSNDQLTASSIEQGYMAIYPQVNQTSTANYVGLLMDVTEAATTAEQDYLMDLRISGTSKFNVTNEGNVGIGTTDPAAELNVNGDILLKNGGEIYSEQDLILENRGGSGDLTLRSDRHFLFQDEGGAQAGYMKIEDGGNVGIGTTAPTAVLHLKAGTASASTAPLKFTAGTALTTPETGAMEFHNDRFYITNVACRRVIDRTCGVITSTTTVSDTTDESTIFTCELPANCLKVGNHTHVEANGVISTATAADDITVTTYVGSDLINTYNPAIGNVTNASWHVEIHMTVRTVGATGTIATHGHVEIDGNEDTANELDTVDTTAANDITIKVQWDNAKAGNTISIYQGAVHWSG